jgi:raffinose/stachyose/melibiose transport system substrate-binding protein
MVSLPNKGLLMNLDEYAAAFGWDEWPVPQLSQTVSAQMACAAQGPSMPWVSTHLTGIFYNKEQAAQIGMTEPPATLAECLRIACQSQSRGLLPIMQWGSAKTAWGSLSRCRLSWLPSAIPNPSTRDLPETGCHDRHSVGT